MKIALIAVALIVVAIAAILAYAATRPDTIAIQRSVRIKAPPAVVFALIDDLHNWPRWAPQDREDPTMTRSYGGAARGVGAISDWTSKGNAGAGHMMIAKSVAGSEVEVHVDFRKPFTAHNVNTFVLEPDDGGTRVTWSMHGTNVYMMKVMSVFVGPDRLLGPHFDAGLANLKAEAEK
jgi:uncharacterized protein YndB with AHSA1/START domain